MISLAKYSLSFKIRKLSLFIAIIALTSIEEGAIAQSASNDKILSYTIDPKKQNVGFYWEDDSGAVFGSIQRLKEYLAHKHIKLVFAMNGGMFKADHSPQGLYVQQHVVLMPLDTSSGYGNFYIKPNGILYITNKNEAVICQTPNFISNDQIEFATQSGPMLLIDGAINPKFRQGSSNVNIRNGVGILPDNKLIFAMSKEPINFYDFADFFRKRGCQNALYLDGFVSRTYLPEKKWKQTDGNFGVIVGVVVQE